MAAQEESSTPEPLETAVAPLNAIAPQDVGAASAAVDEWLRSFTGGYVTLERLTLVLGSIPVVGNVMALVDALGDIVRLVQRKSTDAASRFLDWVSLGINLIGLIPVPPGMAAARMSLRPTLHLVRQNLRQGASNLGESIVMVLTGHLHASIAGELEAFTQRAMDLLGQMLQNCAQLSDDVLGNLIGVLQRVSGQRDLFAVDAPAQAETNTYDPQTQSTWSRLWGAAARYARQSANAAARVAANQLPAEALGRINEVIAGLEATKREFREQLTSLRDPAVQGSLMWLLMQLLAATRRQRAHRSAMVAPQRGARSESDRPPGQLGHVNRQAGAGRDPNACRNCPAPAGRGRTISLALGAESFTHTDFTLAAPLPIEWSRTYRSDLDALDAGSLGARWITPYTVRVDEASPSRGPRTGQPSLVYRAADGRSHAFAPLAVGQFHHDPVEELTVSRPGEALLALDFGKRLPEGQAPAWRELFERVESRDGSAHWRLAAIQGPHGAAIGLRYDHRIAASGEQVLSDILSRQGEAIVAHVGVQPDAATGLIAALWEIRDGQRVRQLAAYVHDEHGDLVSAQDEHGGAWHYRYSHHLVTRYTDRTGRGMNLEYDGTGAHARAVREWADDGSFALAFAWDANIRLTRVSDALGGVTKYYYDIDGYTYRIVHPDAREEWFFRDTAKNVTRHIHPDGSTEDFAYDQAGHLHTHTRADGSRVHYAWDAQHRLVGLRDAEGGVWKREYDAQGNLVEETDPLGHRTEYVYDPAGRPVRITDAKGGVKQLAYTPAGQLASYTDCSGRTARFAYDGQGRLISQSDAAGQATRYRYAGGQLQEITLPDGTREQLSHDAEGRLLAHTDALGRRTRYEYTAAGLIARRIDALGHSLRYRWDLAGRLAGLVNENGSRWAFRHDPVGRLLQEVGFDGRATHYRYEEATGVLAEVAAPGHATQLKFDAMGRLVQRQAQGQVERFAWDGNGRLSEASNAEARLQWYYDAAGNLTREHHHDLPLKRTAVWQHRYGELHQRIATVRPDGHVTQWLTYGAGHVHGLLVDGQEILSIERDELHREVQRTQGNGLVQSLRYDAAGRLSEQRIGPDKAVGSGVASVHALELHRRYAYDRAGQLTGIQDSRRGQLGYRYDPVGRLLQAHARLGREHFAFDPAGNIAAGGEAGAPAKIPAVLDNLLKDYAGTAYRWDARGNLVERTGEGRRTHFEWDGFDRLVAAHEEGGPRTTFHYDPLGRRIAKRTAQASTVFGWDGDVLAYESTQHHEGWSEGWEGQSQEEGRQEGRGWSVHYIHEPGSFVPLLQARQARAMALAPTPDVKALMAANGGRYDIERDPLWNGEYEAACRAGAFSGEQLAFYQCDHLGTPQELTDHQGQLAWSAHYKAWGQAREAISEAGRKAGIANPIRFQGQYFDEETGLHYNRYRYYDPHSGRFVSRDPIGLAGGINLHTYVTNNPNRGIDPLGLVDINLFPTSEAIRESATRIPNPTGTFTVGGHGNSSTIVDAAGNPISPRQMARQIQSHPCYKKGQTVVLMSCNTGAGDDSYAQRLAHELDAPVRAPDQFLWIWPSGATKPAGMRSDRTMDTSAPGRWREFNP